MPGGDLYLLKYSALWRCNIKTLVCILHLQEKVFSENSRKAIVTTKQNLLRCTQRRVIQIMKSPTSPKFCTSSLFKTNILTSFFLSRPFCLLLKTQGKPVFLPDITSSSVHGKNNPNYEEAPAASLPQMSC